MKAGGRGEVVCRVLPSTYRHADLQSGVPLVMFHLWQCHLTPNPSLSFLFSFLVVFKLQEE